MAIGVSRSANYYTVGTVGKISGYNSALPSSYGTAGTVSQNIGASVAFFHIVVKNSGASARDVSAETGQGGVLDVIFRNLPQGILAYFVTNSSAGLIDIVVDGVNCPTAAALQAQLQALGTVNSIDISGTTVALATSFSCS